MGVGTVRGREAEGRENRIQCQSKSGAAIAGKSQTLKSTVPQA